MVRAHLYAYINSLAILLHFYNRDKGFHTDPHIFCRLPESTAERDSIRTQTQGSVQTVQCCTQAARCTVNL